MSRKREREREKKNRRLKGCQLFTLNSVTNLVSAGLAIMVQHHGQMISLSFSLSLFLTHTHTFSLSFRISLFSSLLKHAHTISLSASPIHTHSHTLADVRPVSYYQHSVPHLLVVLPLLIFKPGLNVDVGGQSQMKRNNTWLAQFFASEDNP